MWIKTEEVENGEMGEPQWPRAIAVVKDERTGSHHYHFTYTAPTKPQDQPTAVKRNSSNVPSYAILAPVWPPSARPGANRLVERVGRQRHHAGNHLKPKTPFLKRPMHFGQSIGAIPDHWCPFSNLEGGRYGTQYHSARCCKSQARLLQRSYASIHKEYQPSRLSSSMRTSRTQRLRDLNFSTKHGNRVQAQHWLASASSANARAGNRLRKAFPSDVIDKGRKRETRPPPMLEIHGLAARSIVRQFWCPDDSTLQIYRVALLKRWCHMLRRSLETGEQQFDASELGLRQLWGFVCEKQARLVCKENC